MMTDWRNLKKHHADVVLPLDRRLMERGVAPVVAGVRVGSSSVIRTVTVKIMSHDVLESSMTTTTTHLSRRETTSAWPKEQALCNGIKPPIIETFLISSFTFSL